jgi:ubiquinone/menaquinone biosynthesis C-methylase UbiE
VRDPGLPAPANGIDAFADVAATYEDWFATPLGSFVDRREREALLSILDDVEATSILEVGAGTGHIARTLARPDRRVTAVEPCAPMRREGVRRTGAMPIDWHDGRAEDLPFPDAGFDGALFFTTLEFVARPADALREALRVVRPAGWLVVGFLHACSAWTAAYRRLADGGAMPWAAARFFTRDDLEHAAGDPAERSERAVHLAPEAEPPFEEAERAGMRAGNAPALEVLRWRKRP